jgi:hypothetical protein
VSGTPTNINRTTAELWGWGPIIFRNRPTNNISDAGLPNQWERAKEEEVDGMIKIRSIRRKICTKLYIAFCVWLHVGLFYV